MDPTLSGLHPIEFRLVDPTKGQPVFYLGLPTAVFHLELTNRGARDLRFMPEEGRIEMWFRPGLLDGVSGIRLAPDSVGWTLTARLVGAHQPDEGAVVIQLNRTGRALILLQQASATIRLLGLAASPTRGARESTVRLDYRVRLPDDTVTAGVRHQRVAVLHATQSDVTDEIAALKQSTQTIEKAQSDGTVLAGRVAALEAQVRGLVDVIEVLQKRLPALTADVMDGTVVYADGLTGGVVNLRFRNASGGVLKVKPASTTITVRVQSRTEAAPWGLVNDASRDRADCVVQTQRWARSEVRTQPGERIVVLKPTAEISVGAGESIVAKLTDVIGANQVGEGHLVVEYAGFGDAAQCGALTVAVRRSQVVESADALTVRGLNVEVKTRTADLTKGGALTVSRGATVSGAVLVAEKGATVKGAVLSAELGATISGAELVVQSGATIGGQTTSSDKTVPRPGLVVRNGAVIRDDWLIAERSAVMKGQRMECWMGALVSGAELEADHGATIGGHTTSSDKTVPRPGLVVRNGAVILDDWLIAEQSAVMKGRRMECWSGALVTGGLLEADSGAKVHGGLTLRGDLHLGNHWVIRPHEGVWVGTLQFKCSYQDPVTDLRVTYTLDAPTRTYLPTNTVDEKQIFHDGSWVRLENNERTYGSDFKPVWLNYSVAGDKDHGQHHQAWAYWSEQHAPGTQLTLRQR